MSAADTQLPDAEARRRIREDLGSTLFVEAAAGTGKTSVLVARIVALLSAGEASLDQIVAVTFTEKAAGEMKLRLRSEIERERGSSELGSSVRNRLDTALAQLELARIGTIHAFCGDLLHERPVEAGVDPLFEVSAEEEAEALLDRAFDAWFQQTLSDPPEGVRRVLRRRPRGFDAQGPRASLRVAAGALKEHRDFDSPWRRDPFDRDAAIDRLMAELAALAPLASQARRGDDWLARSLREIEGFVTENALREEVRGRDHDALEAELRELKRARHWRWKGGGQLYGEGLQRADVRAQRDQAKQELDQLLEASDCDLAPLLREELRPVIEAYEAAKRRAGVLDFLDLLLCARDLVRGNAVVRAELQQRFTRFFVDEFQDTDPLQAEILLLLAADDPSESDPRAATPVPGKLFLVGDPKQAIYRFRRADVAVYEATKRQLLERGGELIHLTTNFRALPELQSVVNAAFEPEMQGSEDGSQAEYVALESWRPSRGSQPAVIALPVPRPYSDYGRVVNWKIDESLPDAVGAFVQWLVKESGWKVAESDGREVDVAPRHVCLLFRRFKSFREDVTRPYVRALEVRHVPHVLVGGRSFHDREEVLAIRNALCAIEWPSDELRVFATLRGPLFALGDDALLAFRDRCGSLNPLRRFDQADMALPEREVAEALAVLAELNRHRNHRPIADTISRLLQAVRAHAGIAIWPTGEQALANCLRVIDRARSFESRAATSFRSFVAKMEEEAELAGAEDAPVVEEGSEGVRIMTVHKAKGLEFPVVVLVDPTCNRSRGIPSRHVDTESQLWAEPLCGCVPAELLEAREEESRRDDAEAVRVAYVAATRARDLLVVPVVGDEELSGWIDLLNPVVHPERKLRRQSKPAPGCPVFAEDSVFARPTSASRGSGASVAPGLHAPRRGSHEVVWWDPAALPLDVDYDEGLRQTSILEADESGEVVQAGESAHEGWQRARRAALERGAVASLEVRSVTAIVETPDEATAADAREVRLERVSGKRRGRPGGKRFGTLVHAVLAVVDLEADASAVAAAVRSQGRLVGASEDELVAAESAAVAALAHPLLRRAARSEALRRETPVLFRRENAGLVEGVVDLAFREEQAGGARWTVVDFKTDREIGTRQTEYEAQVRLYVDGISAATGEAADGVLLVV